MDNTIFIQSTPTPQYWWLANITAYNCSSPFSIFKNVQDPYFIMGIIYGIIALVIVFIGVRFYLVTSSLLHAMVTSIVISACVYYHITTIKWIYQILIVVACTLLATTLISIVRPVSRVFISFYFGSIMGILLMVMIRYFTMLPQLFISPIVIIILAIIITIPLMMIQEYMFGLPMAGIASTLFVVMLDYLVGQRSITRIVLITLTSLQPVNVYPCWQHWALVSMWIGLTVVGTFVQYALAKHNLKIEFDE